MHSVFTSSTIAKMHHYAQALETCLYTYQFGRAATNAQSLHNALNGQAHHYLRSISSVHALRESGAYFTEAKLAKRLVSKESTHMDKHTIFDPACGIGDLLLAAATKLKVYSNLEDTLEYWGSRLAGCDTVPVFIGIARVRLALLAVSRGATTKRRSRMKLAKYLSNIKCANGLETNELYERSSLVLMNPPFTMRNAPSKCSWASGRVNSAALFVEKCVTSANSGTKMQAILPEVLRSGSRYYQWRLRVSQHLSSLSVALHGQFNRWADVHVFLAKTTIGSSNSSIDWKNSYAPQVATIGDHFLVHVGPVVPHRHPETGKLLPYLHARNALAWATITQPRERRRFSGTTYMPPFVAIKRTSRPEDRHRATGTVVTGRHPIAVENHLIICKPITNTLVDCLRLMQVLQSDLINTVLNERIRCRHLTVLSVRELPFSVEI